MAKRDEAKLTMHKLLGDHKMVKVEICKECGVTEGQQVIEPYKPVHLTADQIFELMNSIMRLAEEVRHLREAQVNRDRESVERIRKDMRPWERERYEDRWKKEYEMKPMEPKWDELKRLLPEDSDIKKYETTLKDALEKSTL